MSDLLKRMRATLQMGVIATRSSAQEYAIAESQFKEAYHRIEALEAEQAGERCEHCGCDKIYSGPPDCSRCGAPVCCEICCKEQALNDHIEALQAKLDAVQTETHKWKNEECSAQQAVEKIHLIALQQEKSDA
jgi:hypothetical protein